VITLVENNPRALQSNSAAVSRRFSDGNVPLNGQRKARAAKARPTIEELREYLDYEPETGVLRWKQQRGRAIVGRIAGSLTKNGYMRVKVKGAKILAHCIGFALHYGRWPNPCCDHIDGNKLNNRADNLRECSLAENQHNRRISRNNTSGVKGVSKCPRRNLWKAGVKLWGKEHYKHFRRLEDAAAWVKQMREQLHGEFARH
jgi:hypothetical protein